MIVREEPSEEHEVDGYALGVEGVLADRKNAKNGDESQCDL